MAESDFLRALDDSIVDAFAHAGMGDSATLRRAGATTTTACRVLVDGDSRFLGELSTARSNVHVITAFRAEIGNVPQRGDEFTVGAAVYRVESLLEEDASRVVAIVELC